MSSSPSVCERGRDGVGVEGGARGYDKAELGRGKKRIRNIPKSVCRREALRRLKYKEGSAQQSRRRGGEGGGSVIT